MPRLAPAPSTPILFVILVGAIIPGLFIVGKVFSAIARMSIDISSAFETAAEKNAGPPPEEYSTVRTLIVDLVLFLSTMLTSKYVLAFVLAAGIVYVIIEEYVVKRA